MFNMKHVTFSKGNETIGYLVTPAGCKPLDRAMVLICTKMSWIDTNYLNNLSGVETLRRVTRRYAGWNKKVIIV